VLSHRFHEAIFQTPCDIAAVVDVPPAKRMPANPDAGWPIFIEHARNQISCQQICSRMCHQGFQAAILGQENRKIILLGGKRTLPWVCSSGNGFRPRVIWEIPDNVDQRKYPL